jgi:hypothetical protein
MSTPPKGCKNPTAFREWATPLCPDRAEAIRLLNIAVEEINTLCKLVRGRTFADYAAQEIDERYQRSLHRVNHPVAARKRIQSWANIVKNWLPKAPFWGWPPSAIRLENFQAYIKWLETKARDRSGDPLSASLVRNIIQQVRAVFRIAGVNPEASGKVKQPPKKTPDVESLTLEQQCKFFACKDIPIEDRLMAGIGMGLAVRVGELLPLERQGREQDAQDRAARARTRLSQDLATRSLHGRGALVRWPERRLLQRLAPALEEVVQDRGLPHAHSPHAPLVRG